MPDDDERYEYVLNDSGHIYWGGRRPKPWWFGQVSLSSGLHVIIKLSCTYAGSQVT